MRTLVRLVAAAGSLAIVAAFILAMRRPGGADLWWVLVLPALTAAAVIYVVRHKPPRGLAWILIGSTVATTIGTALYLSVTRTDAGGAIAWLILGPSTFLAAGIYLLIRKPDNRSGWLMTAAAAATLAFSAPVEQLVWSTYRTDGIRPWMSVVLGVESVVVMAGVACLALLIGLFPDGVPRDRVERLVTRTVWVAPLLMVVVLITNEYILLEAFSYTGLDPLPSPIYIPALGGLSIITAPLRYLAGLVVVVGIWLLFRRYRAVEENPRRQIRWVLYGSGAGVSIGILPYAISLMLAANGPTHSPLASLSIVGVLMVPASVVTAIENPAAIDTDAVIRRSFGYAALSLGIFVVYAAVAAGLGLAAGAALPIEVAIAVTAVLAFAFQPARRRLQLVADRWVFGAQPSPLEAVTTFDRSVRSDEAGSSIGELLADTARRAARLQWAAVVLPPEPHHLSGMRRGEPDFEQPIYRDDERYGRILCGPKVRGQFTQTDRDLIEALAGQAALVISNARLATRIVQAQEAERRRLERNIHDGAQQELVALVAKLGLARTRAQQGELDETTLIELQRDAGTILKELRELAQGIHPSVLTDGGLVEAVEDRCGRLPIDVQVSMTPGLRSVRFGDDVEGAAYFFVTEGLANVLKHADATRVDVEIERRNGHLHLQVSDDGDGFDTSVTPLNGLEGLRDRFVALNGDVAIRSVVGSGTMLTARIPIEDAT